MTRRILCISLHCMYPPHLYQYMYLYPEYPLDVLISAFLQINHNGLISVGSRYSRAGPSALDKVSQDVLAVFWAASDMSSSSKVIYQSFERDDEQSVQTLDHVTTLINECANLDGEFTATWMLVVTWEKISPYARFIRRFLWFFSSSYNPYLDEVRVEN